jgi:uncharacterized membrane protein YdjX (TVP38/TMEM64 family)
MPKPTKSPPKTRLRWLVPLAFVALALVLFQSEAATGKLRAALDGIAGLGPWGPLLFIVLYVVATVLFVPGSALTLGAGAVFGLAWGSVWVSLGSTLGAAASFLIGRHLARDAVQRRLGQNRRFTALDAAVAEAGWKIVFLVRLSPVFPFGLLNYAFGLTRVKFTHYLLASWIGMMPGTVLYVYLGTLARAATGNDSPRTVWEWVALGVGLLATLGVVVQVGRIARRSLAGRLGP